MKTFLATFCYLLGLTMIGGAIGHLAGVAMWAAAEWLNVDPFNLAKVVGLCILVIFSAIICAVSAAPDRPAIGDNDG